MISYKNNFLERQSLSEVKMGRGSPICERARKKIVKYFKNNVPQHFPLCFLIRHRGYSSGHYSPPLSEGSRVATMDSRIKCPETEMLSNVQKCSFVVSDQCRRYVCKKKESTNE